MVPVAPLLWLGNKICSIQTAKRQYEFAAPHVTATVALLQEFGILLISADVTASPVGDTPTQLELGFSSSGSDGGDAQLS